MPIKVGDATGLMAYSPASLANIVGRVLADRSKTFGVCWNQKPDGSVQGSLSLASDFDFELIRNAFPLDEDMPFQFQTQLDYLQSFMALDAKLSKSGTKPKL